jgi:hypothetical protein
LISLSIGPFGGLGIKKSELDTTKLKGRINIKKQKNKLKNILKI